MRIQMKGRPRVKLEHCIKGYLTCKRCENKSVAAIETAFGYTPLCTQCTKEAEERGYKVIKTLPAFQDSGLPLFSGNPAGEE